MREEVVQTLESFNSREGSDKPAKLGGEQLQRRFRMELGGSLGPCFFFDEGFFGLVEALRGALLGRREARSKNQEKRVHL